MAAKSPSLVENKENSDVFREANFLPQPNSERLTAQLTEEHKTSSKMSTKYKIQNAKDIARFFLKLSQKLTVLH